MPKLADVKLIVRIITFAAIEGDEEFFEGFDFKNYCAMIRVCPIEVRLSLCQ